MTGVRFGFPIVPVVTTPPGPAGLTDVALWLRAKDLGVNGSSVTAWADAAAVSAPGASQGTAPTVVTGSTPNGGKSVRFANTGNIVVPNVGGRGRCTASSMFDSTNYQPCNAIDNSNGTSNGDTWASSALPAWWQIELATAEVITTYRIAPASQYPTAWTLQGSNDGTNFTTLDTRTGQTLTSGTYSSAYTFSNSTPYKIYRLNVTAANGGAIVNITQIELGGVANSLTTTQEIWAVIKSDAAGAAAEGVWNLGGVGGSGASYWPYDGTTVYEGFAIDDAIGTNFNPGVALTSWRLYRIANDGTTWQAWIDGTSKLTRSSLPPVWARVPTIGKNRVGWFYTGNIAELLIRRSVSGTSDVAMLKAYFNSEHGLTVT